MCGGLNFIHTHTIIQRIDDLDLTIYSKPINYDEKYLNEINNIKTPQLF